MLPLLLMAGLASSVAEMPTPQVEDCAVAAFKAKDAEQWLAWAAVALERHRVLYPQVGEDDIQHASLNRLWEKRFALEDQGLNDPAYFRAYFQKSCPVLPPVGE